MHFLEVTTGQIYFFPQATNGMYLFLGFLVTELQLSLSGFVPYNPAAPL